MSTFELIFLFSNFDVCWVLCAKITEINVCVCMFVYVCISTQFYSKWAQQRGQWYDEISEKIVLSYWPGLFFVSKFIITSDKWS